MCGLVGCIDLLHERPIEKDIIIRMSDKLKHRGPDDVGYFLEGSVGLGFRRLSIIDIEGGQQPLFNEDKSVVLVCNGEIYNYHELRNTLVQKGHVFQTKCDVEVLVHLFEDNGVDFLNMLNGQFALAIYDSKNKRLLLARDHFGIAPLFYTIVDRFIIFASEIKALLTHPLVPREVDLTGLDQIMSFPGLVSPRTMFKGIASLKSGNYITVKDSQVQVIEYWDLDYPDIHSACYDKPAYYYIDRLAEILTQSVNYRLQADVPVGLYLSGGLDSSLIAVMVDRVSPTVQRHSFSIDFTEKEISEAKYQRIMAKYINSLHHEILFDWSQIANRLPEMIYHCECPVKETYNTCSLALSEAARKVGVPVVLTGEGADELFAGYVGYRFDRYGARGRSHNNLDMVLEEQINERIWGSRDIFYEINHQELRDIKTALYSNHLNAIFKEFDCLNFELVNKERLRNRHPVHQRSYLDFKLRLSDHLISDHGDRMSLANSVEARYPFLDINLIDFSRHISPNLKLNEFSEKYILKEMARPILPNEILRREKYGFNAPGSPYMLQSNVEWVRDMLSYERIKRQGYFNPDVVEQLVKKFSRNGFKLNLPFENDFLVIVLTLSIFLEIFRVPDFH